MTRNVLVDAIGVLDVPFRESNCMFVISTALEETLLVLIST